MQIEIIHLIFDSAMKVFYIRNLITVIKLGTTTQTKENHKFNSLFTLVLNYFNIYLL